jgi:hypothetical protein
MPAMSASEPLGLWGNRAGGGSAVRQGVLHGDLVVVRQLFRSHLWGIKLALTVPDRHIQGLHAAGKYAGRIGIDGHPHPLIPEIPAVVIGQGHRSSGIVSIDAGQQAQVDQGLESVADTDDQFLRSHKIQQRSPIFVFSRRA